MRRNSTCRAHAVLVALKLNGPLQQWAIYAWWLTLLVQSSFAAETNSPVTQTPPAETAELRLEDLTKLEIPTVEGASKYSQKTTEAPASVSIITADDVKKYGYRTLAEILQSVRGLNVSYDRNYALLG